MFQVYLFLFVLVLINKINSDILGNKYFLYEINKDKITNQCPCDDETRYPQDFIEFEDLEEDDAFVYDEEINFIPYDTINDAVHQINAETRIFDNEIKRISRSLYQNNFKENKKDDRETNGDIDGTDISEEFNMVQPKYYGNEFENLENQLLERETSDNQIINSLHESENVDELKLDSVIDRENQYKTDEADNEYNYNEILDEEKLNFVKTKLKVEKIKLLKTDEYLHDIISTIDKFNDYEFGISQKQSFDTEHPDPVLDFDDELTTDNTEVYTDNEYDYPNIDEKSNPNNDVLESVNNIKHNINENSLISALKERPIDVFKEKPFTCNNIENSNVNKIYELETKRNTKKYKRNINDDLHHFEIPKIEDIPKVHELPEHHVNQLWNEFKNKFNKNYRKSADPKKMHHWKTNMKKIHDHNMEARDGLHSYTLEDNHLSDLHPRQYMRTMTKLTKSRIRRHSVRHPEHNDSVVIPDHFDWRDKGFITPDWNQEQCGACYAFSIASIVEGQLYKNTGTLEDLSIQQVVDCSIISGNLGCAGGSLRNTLNYVQFTGGLMTDKDYPYKGKQSICRFRKYESVVDISSWSVIPPQDEHALKVTLATIGPVAVSINASPVTFQLYSSGIYDDIACSEDHVNHAMLLVGYTKNSWILKNWWSKNWGDNGYMYLKRGHNRCGISNYAVYALI